jgi:hypothetical protein
MRVADRDFLKLERAFVVRSTATWTPDSTYLSWAARDFGMPWSNLKGAILFPTDSRAHEFVVRSGGYVVPVWTDELDS